MEKGFAEFLFQIAKRLDPCNRAGISSLEVRMSPSQAFAEAGVPSFAAGLRQLAVVVSAVEGTKAAEVARRMIELKKPGIELALCITSNPDRRGLYINTVKGHKKSNTYSTAAVRIADGTHEVWVGDCVARIDQAAQEFLALISRGVRCWKNEYGEEFLNPYGCGRSGVAESRKRERKQRARRAHYRYGYRGGCYSLA